MEKKSLFLNFGSKSALTGDFCGKKIVPGRVVKYLGILIDNKLTFKDHANLIVKKLSKFNGLVYKIRRYFNKKQLLVFYQAFAQSIINYGILTYGSAPRATLNGIWLAQKKIIRTIYFKKKYDTTADVCREHVILSVFELYVFELFKLLFNELRCHDNRKYLSSDQILTRPRTRRAAKNLQNSVSFKTNHLKFSIKRRIVLAYNFARENDLIPENLQEMSHSSYKKFLTTFRNNYIFDNKPLLELFF